MEMQVPMVGMEDSVEMMEMIVSQSDLTEGKKGSLYEGSKRGRNIHFTNRSFSQFNPYAKVMKLRLGREAACHCLGMRRETVLFSRETDQESSQQ